MYVGAADAADLYLHQDVLGAQLGFGLLFDTQIMSAIEYCTFHDDTSVLSEPLRAVFYTQYNRKKEKLQWITQKKIPFSCKAFADML